MTTARLFSLEGETALVTGGTRGIGKAMALALAEAGAKVLLVQRNARDTTTQDEINEKSPAQRQSSIYAADLTAKDSVEALVPQIEAHGHRITILLNCAGVIDRHPCSAFPTDVWNNIIQVNLSSVFLLSRDVARHMLDNNLARGRRGTIINVGSIISFQGGLNVAAYAASKGGLLQLTKSFSNELAGKGITVNGIAPGYCNTDMNTALLEDKDRLRSITERIPMGRWGEAGDFAGPIVFLASRASSYVTGETMMVDGGWMGR